MSMQLARWLSGPFFCVLDMRGILIRNLRVLVPRDDPQTLEFKCSCKTCVPMTIHFIYLVSYYTIKISSPGSCEKAFFTHARGSHSIRNRVSILSSRKQKERLRFAHDASSPSRIVSCRLSAPLPTGVGCPSLTSSRHRRRRTIFCVI